MTLILLAILAYPLARAIDRYIQRRENGVFVRRRAAMHEQAVFKHPQQSK